MKFIKNEDFDLKAIKLNKISEYITSARIYLFSNDKDIQNYNEAIHMLNLAIKSIEDLKAEKSSIKESVDEEIYIAVLHVDDNDGTWIRVAAADVKEAAEFAMDYIKNAYPGASYYRVDVDDYNITEGQLEESSEEVEDENSDETITQSEQEFDSAKTSINSSKLPAIFKLVHFTPNTINLDYGGGKFDNATEYLKADKDVTNLIYDPFNRPHEHNIAIIKQIRQNGGADTATLSNVLNVIKEPHIRKEVLTNISKLLKPSGTLYITVYEGKGDGQEGPSSSGYQLHRKTRDYEEEIKEVFPNVKVRGKLIIANK